MMNSKKLSPDIQENVVIVLLLKFWWWFLHYIHNSILHFPFSQHTGIR